MDNKLKTDQLRMHFDNRIFSYHELLRFYQNYEININENTARVRLFRLKQSGIITKVKNDAYMIANKQNFELKPNKYIQKLYKDIKNQYPYANLAIWETKWLTDHMVHQPVMNLIIVEVDKDASNSVFNYLKENAKYDVYLNPGKKEVENYISNNKNSIIVKNLIFKSPTDDSEGVSYPRAEKILVDLFMDKDLYLTYQGKELKNIYKSFFEKYNMNLTTLLGYAERRRIKEKIEKFLNETNVKLGSIVI